MDQVVVNVKYIPAKVGINCDTGKYVMTAIITPYRFSKGFACL